MNFYKAQEEARKQSRKLVLLFCLAVVTLVLLTNAVLIISVWLSGFGKFSELNQVELASLPWYQSMLIIIETFGWDKVAAVTLIVISVIGMATGFKWSDLSKGGHVVAELLGGRRISPDTKEPHERRLVNVVEEMALASQMSVPAIFVLSEEQGINAFAAGISIDDAVVAVSQGAIEQLNREQLQGVVAHEFSHILNGDMRLNVRMVAILHGLTMINEAGRVLIHSTFRSSRYSSGSRVFSSNRKRGGGHPLFLAIGVVLWILGTIGQFFGKLIKAALSRQREYLADASAVQFTRNPTGIGEALQIIGGYGHRSNIGNPRAHELGHFFFSAAFASRVFATHPPIDERIERLLPSWNGRYVESTAEAELKDMFGDAAVMGFASGDHGGAEPREPIEYAPGGIDTPDQANPESQTMHDPEKTTSAASSATTVVDMSNLLSRVHHPEEAKAVFFAFIGHSSVTTGDWITMLDPLELKQKLDILRAAIPALRELEPEQYSAFKRAFIDAIRADNKRSVAEWLAYEMFRNPCDVHFGFAKSPPLKYKNVQSISGFYELVLVKLIRMGTQDKSLHDQALIEAKRASGIHIGSEAIDKEISGKAFTNACYALKQAFPLLKPRIIKGLLAAAHADEQFCETEQQLIAVLAAIWDLPIPALLVSEEAA